MSGRRPPGRTFDPVAVGSAAAGRLPATIAPMLVMPGGEPFDSPSHIFEVKWDGVRAVAFIEAGAVRLHDRFQRDITHLYPELQGIGACVGGDGVVLDGEIVALDDAGRPQFALLEPRLAAKDASETRQAAQRQPLTYQAFDVLYHQGRPVMGQPLWRRKRLLHELVRAGGALRAPDFVEREGVAFFMAAREHDLEGIIAKQRDSPYLPGERSSAWLKVKVYEKEEFVIGGYTFGGRPRAGKPGRAKEPFASLLLGLYDGQGRLAYVGETTGGFTQEGAQRTVAVLDALQSPRCPFAEPPRLPRLIFWCRPELACSVRFGGWSGGRLQFPVFESLRPDVPAESCLLEQLATT